MSALDSVNGLHTPAVPNGTAESFAPATESGLKGQGTVLIIDPAATRRWTLLQMIGELVGKVHEANTTSEGLAAIARFPVDLVMIDLRAPEVGAVHFCRELRKSTNNKFTQVFVMAESDTTDNEVNALEAGANQFVAMPLRERAFKARVQSTLRHKAMIDSLDDSESVLFSLAKSVEDRDPDLSLHCQRLSIMASAVGVALKLPAHEVNALQRGGYLHDIGKISIPDRVLFKPGPLTPDEWEIMKSHTLRGETICSSIKSLAPVLPIIRHHHERWDGLGYPDGLRGEQIPLLARILQLADIYDALTTIRPYKAAFSSEEALQIIMEETGKGWRDPHLVRVFADLVPMFRTTSLPELSRFSLHALANSVDSAQGEAAEAKHRTEKQLAKL